MIHRYHVLELCAVVPKSSSGDEIPERDVPYLLSVYLFTTELDIPVLQEYFLSNAYLLHI